jgi:hypothetical protein
MFHPGAIPESQGLFTMAVEKYSQPCNYSKALMWLIGALVAIFAIMSKSICDQVDRNALRIDKQDAIISNLNGSYIKQSADLEYIKAAVTEIRQDMRSKQ